MVNGRWRDRQRFTVEWRPFTTASWCSTREGLRMTSSKRFACVAGSSTILVVTLAAQTQPPLFIYTHAEGRTRYLANAVIWQDPGPLTPEDIRRGPKAAIPEAIANAGDQPIECRYERPG